MKVVIMAGGKGTRISSVASDIPKPMIKVEGIPVLEREIECLKNQGFDDIILTVSHLGNIIMDYFGDGSGNSPVTGEPFGVHIDYYFEEEPLGNAGALFKIKDKLTSDFLLLNADAMFDVDFNRFVAFHRKHGGLVTLFTHPNSHPYDSGLIIANKNGSVEKWLAKEDERPQYYRNRVNAGLHVINPKVLELVGINADSVGKVGVDGKPVKVDLDRQLLKPLAGTGKMFCYDSPEYVKDMGTPERYYSVCKDCKEGRISAKNLKNKQKAIFLDRDGTINKYVGFLRNINDFELIDGVAEATFQEQHRHPVSWRRVPPYSGSSGHPRSRQHRSDSADIVPGDFSATVAASATFLWPVPGSAQIAKCLPALSLSGVLLPFSME